MNCRELRMFRLKSADWTSPLLRRKLLASGRLDLHFWAGAPIRRPHRDVELVVLDAAKLLVLGRS